MKNINKLVSFFIFSFFISNYSRNIEQFSSSTVKSMEVKTLEMAGNSIKKIIINMPTASQLDTYEKNKSTEILQCAKILYNEAKQQLLQALQEIGKRLLYWQYQKDHQLSYFIMKHPKKWLTGKTQEEEINDILDQLKSHQGELFVLLGQFSLLDNEFNKGYKDSFLKDYKKKYEWIDQLLDKLARIPSDKHDEVHIFISRAKHLEEKLQKVREFKTSILSEIPETSIPSGFERNWLKYSALLLALQYGYKNISYEQLSGYFQAFSQNISNYIVAPIKDLIASTFGVHVTGKDVNTLSETHQNTIRLTKQFVIDNSSILKLSSEQIKKINRGLEVGDYTEFQKFLHLLGSGNIVKQVKNITRFGVGQVNFLTLLGTSQALTARKQTAALMKLLLLVPAVATGWSVYAGYKKLTERDFTSLRRALVDINSLFVNQTRPLNDEEYGAMIFLIFNLKQQAATEIKNKNDKDNFIADIERLESHEYDVAAKRRIVEDMFKKYDFLGLIHQKSA